MGIAAFLLLGVHLGAWRLSGWSPAVGRRSVWAMPLGRHHLASGISRVVVHQARAFLHRPSCLGALPDSHVPEIETVQGDRQDALAGERGRKRLMSADTSRKNCGAWKRGCKNEESAGDAQG